MEPIIYIDSVVSFCDCKYNDYYWEKQEKTHFFRMHSIRGDGFGTMDLLS